MKMTYIEKLPKEVKTLILRRDNLMDEVSNDISTPNSIILAHIDYQYRNDGYKMEDDPVLKEIALSDDSLDKCYKIIKIQKKIKKYFDKDNKGKLFKEIDKQWKKREELDYYIEKLTDIYHFVNKNDERIENPNK